MLEYALKYAALGWAIFPCRPGDKRPRHSTWVPRRHY
ncbi:MAG: bifunctional DNA primase/polymerase [Candidatus Latescibacterota bacterium]